MNTKMISENRTLENSFVNGFDPVNHDKWIEELIGEVNWPENSSTEDVDVVLNFDDDQSNDLIGRDYIKKMTEKFIENGGEITILPTSFDSGINSVSRPFKLKNSNSNPKEWNVDSEYLKYHRKSHHLCPYNIFRKYYENTDGVRYEN